MDCKPIMIETMNNIINQPGPVKITGLGTRFKIAREAMHLSEKEAGIRLHLGANIISLIENESFSNGPPIIFMRGYVRSYARLLNVSEDDIKPMLTELDKLMPVTNIIPPVLKTVSDPHSDRYLHWATYLIVLILIGLMSLWWNSHSHYILTATPIKPSANPPSNVVEKPPLRPVAMPVMNPQPQQPIVTQPINANMTPAPVVTPVVQNPVAPLSPTVNPTPQPEQAQKTVKTTSGKKPHRTTPTISGMPLALPEPGDANNH